MCFVGIGLFLEVSCLPIWIEEKKKKKKKFLVD